MPSAQCWSFSSKEPATPLTGWVGQERIWGLLEKTDSSGGLCLHWDRPAKRFLTARSKGRGKPGVPFAAGHLPGR